jgi:hypothetical protein
MNIEIEINTKSSTIIFGLFWRKWYVFSYLSNLFYLVVAAVVVMSSSVVMYVATAKTRGSTATLWLRFQCSELLFWNCWEEIEIKIYWEDQVPWRGPMTSVKGSTKISSNQIQNFTRFFMITKNIWNAYSLQKFQMSEVKFHITCQKSHSFSKYRLIIEWIDPRRIRILSILDPPSIKNFVIVHVTVHHIGKANKIYCCQKSKYTLICITTIDLKHIAGIV